uniref:Uncharacterized protein n=1 Tax=Aegilops tauschii subsp. strangulata TaxID=200361 RepID=A0A453IE36_AEGTS
CFCISSLLSIYSFVKQFWARNNLLDPNRSAPLGSCNTSIVEGEAENSPEEQCFIGKNHYSCLHPFVSHLKRNYICL